MRDYHHQYSNCWRYLRFPSTSFLIGSRYHYIIQQIRHFIMSYLTAECLHFSTSFLEGSGFSNSRNTGLGLLPTAPLLAQPRDDLESSWSTESLKSTSLNGQLPCCEPEGCYFDLQLGNCGPYIGSWSPFESCTTFLNQVSHYFISPSVRTHHVIY
jgi:hypothetical protein